MKFGGFALLAAGLFLAAGAYRPGALDPSMITLPTWHSKADAASPAVKSHSPNSGRMAFYPGPSLRALAGLSVDHKPKLILAASAAQNSVAEPQPTLVAYPAPVPRQVRRAVFLKTKEPASRRALVRSIKRALRTAGCFDGALNGKWNSTVKDALGAFMQRANASLPYESPDYVHLTLVRTHAAISCAEHTCPAGQTASAGRCLPAAILAHAPAKPSKPTASDVGAFETTVTFANTIPPRRQLAHASQADRPAPLPGRMAVGAPGSEADGEDGDWWDVLFGGGTSGASDPMRTANVENETLDRPAGLTHVPLHPVVRTGGALPQPRQVRHTRLENGTIVPVRDPSGAIPIETAALQLQEPSEASQRNAEERAYRKKVKARRAAKTSKKRRSARRYSSRRSRSVQALFKHPLGQF